MTSPRYHTSGQTRPWTTKGWQDRSDPNARFEQPATAWDLFKFGLPGGLFLAGLAVIATFAIVAFHGAFQ